jgi:hypothetical protein
MRPGLLDHLVGAREQHGRNVETQRFRRLQVDDKLEFGRLFNRQISRLAPSQNPIDVSRAAPKQVGNARATGVWARVPELEMSTR